MKRPSANNSYSSTGSRLRLRGTRSRLGLLALCLCLVGRCVLPAADVGEDPAANLPKDKSTMRMGAAQPRSRLIDWRLTNVTEVLKRVDTSLRELEQIVHRAGAAGCDAL